MKKDNLFKLTFLIFTIIQMILKGKVTEIDAALILIITAIDIIIEKFSSNPHIIYLQLGLVFYSVYLNPNTASLFGILVFNIINYEAYPGIIILFLLLMYLLGRIQIDLLLLIIIISWLYAYKNNKFFEREKIFKRSLDDERRLRYELEITKARLLNSEREIAHIAEIKERNRIAREIHDKIGHSIAGTLIQLQAAEKLYLRNDPRAFEHLNKGIENLSNSLDVVRNTVHNIKPKEDVGIDYIKSLIQDFSFCSVDFKCIGDMSSIPSNIIEIISTNIKEALTNASKYSCADRIIIEITSNEKYIRLYIKDNGKGANIIKEGLGLSGMKERVRNVGGSYSVSGDDGFLIVCVIPWNLEGGLGVL